jgi:Ni/Co efflux regulator RcnB
MRTKLLAIVALLAFTATPAVLAQQVSVQGDRSDSATERQTTSATWTTSSSPPEQAGDLYRARTRGNDEVGNITTQDDPLSGALNPGTEPLGGNKQADPKE